LRKVLFSPSIFSPSLLLRFSATNQRSRKLLYLTTVGRVPPFLRESEANGYLTGGCLRLGGKGGTLPTVVRSPMITAQNITLVAVRRGFEPQRVLILILCLDPLAYPETGISRLVHRICGIPIIHDCLWQDFSFRSRVLYGGFLPLKPRLKKKVPTKNTALNFYVSYVLLSRPEGKRGKSAARGPHLK